MRAKVRPAYFRLSGFILACRHCDVPPADTPCNLCLIMAVGISTSAVGKLVRR